MTQCSTCGQVINEVVIIDGKPYGTTCALNKLGMRNFPTWFRGGDWNKAKKSNEDSAKNMATQFEAAKAITRDAWTEWVLLSKAFRTQYNRQNQWGADFLSSIIRQLGYPSTLANTSWDTMDEAEKNWKNYDGDFPYIFTQPRSIETLSEKQKSLINKFC